MLARDGDKAFHFVNRERPTHPRLPTFRFDLFDRNQWIDLYLPAFYQPVEKASRRFQLIVHGLWRKFRFATPPGLKRIGSNRFGRVPRAFCDQPVNAKLQIGQMFF
jgi:hypothetical protein